MSEDEFEQQASAYRGELLAYCYRMLGSPHDAEDLVQDTYVRAWRARERYDASRASLRTWLYRIATNVCLTALESRARRPLPSGLVAECEPTDPFVPFDGAWLHPLPDAMLGDPASLVADRSTLRIAFAAALQLLSARERGALVLRDVLAFSAAESAEMLGMSTAAVNSALQRARGRLEDAGTEPVVPAVPEQREWIERYLRAFERADVAGLTRLLSEDVVMEMPPMVNWFSGPGNYGVFMEWVFAQNGTDFRCVAVEANGQQGFAAYRRAGTSYVLHTLQILAVTADGISRNSVFLDQAVFDSFGLPAELS